MSVTCHYAPTPYGPIHYRSAGEPDAPPLVLLHQTAGSSVMYAALMAELSADFWLFAPDTPGFGASFVPQQAPTVALYAAAIWAALRTRTSAPLALFGHHTGAAIALQMAHSVPEQVSHLLLSGPPLLTPALIDKLRAGLPRFEPTEAYLRATWARIAAKGAGVSAELIYRETLLTLQAADQLTAAYEAVFAHDFAGQLAAVSCPTLVVAGENDSLRRCLEPSYALLQNGQMRLLPDAGTYVCDQQPRQMAELIRSFLLPAQTGEER